MEDDEGTAPKRARRRAVRPAGPIAGATTPVLAETEKVVLAKETEKVVPPEATEKAVPSEAAPQSSEQVADGEGKRPERAGIVLTALFVVVVLALLAAGVYLFLGIRSANADDAQAERYVQTARQTVLNLTTIHPDSAQEDVDRLLEGASGDFKAEFEGREGPFVEVVKQARVDSNGEIIEAGIESSGDGFAEVLVAARAMVQNSDAAEPQPRDFRLRIRVADDGGVLTASRVEFVP